MSKIHYVVGDATQPQRGGAAIIGQHGLKRAGGVPPVRYPAIRQGLAAVREHAEKLDASVHMPRIGCGLAGGDWETVEQLITSELSAYGVDVTVYDLPD